MLPFTSAVHCSLKNKMHKPKLVRIYTFLIFINNLSVTKTVYPAKSQNHKLQISKLGFINKTSKNGFVNLHRKLQMKLKNGLFNKKYCL